MGDGEQDRAQHEPVANSTSDATSGTRNMPASRSVASMLLRSWETFSTPSRTALRAAASGGRPRPAPHHMAARHHIPNVDPRSPTVRRLARVWVAPSAAWREPRPRSRPPGRSHAAGRRGCGAAPQLPDAQAAVGADQDQGAVTLGDGAGQGGDLGRGRNRICSRSTLGSGTREWASMPASTAAPMTLPRSWYAFWTVAVPGVRRSGRPPRYAHRVG